MEGGEVGLPPVGAIEGDGFGFYVLFDFLGTGAVEFYG